MFLVGTNGQDVNEYTLSTGFDLSSTVNFIGSFDVSSQEIYPSSITFNNDGTKMFVSGHSGDDVNEYSLTTPFSLVNVSGEHSGDVINTSSTDNYDTDPDDDTLTITSITATTAGGGAQTTFSSNTETVTGSYGTLTINSNGSYQYAATLDATDALDAGDVVTDVFTYIVSDGQGETDTATITITVIGVNDTPVADTETGSVDTNSTLTVTDGTSDLLHGDTDADASASLSVSSIVATTAGGSATAVNPGTAYNSGYTSVTGSYGALRVGADGTYQYIASSSSGTDVFTYTLSDGTATHDATLTITINNSAPTASNSTVYINENNQESTAGDRTPSNITKVFAASDFNFSDTDGGSLSKVKITTLESAGDLEYNNGSSWVDVTENQEITASDISNNKLRFTPAANSESNPTFGFKVHDGTDYSSSAYTMTISVNAAPNVTDTTVAGTVAAGATTSSADIHTIVADSDDNDSVLVVTGVASGNESSNNTIITNNTGVGSAVSGTYGSLTVAADGTYTYTASATNNIAYNSTATDTFTFTTRDDEGSSGNAGSHAYDVGTITFTVASSVSLVADTDTVNEDATVTVADGDTEDVLEDDTSATTVSHIGTASDSLTSISTSQAITGTYGTLTMYATGAYSYVADQSAADALTAGVSADDVFYYKAAGATTTLTIAVTGIGPLAANDAANVNEDATVAGTASVTGTGVLGNDDGNASYDTESLRVTRVSTDNFSTATTVDDDDNADTIDGTYGTLTIYKTGQYSYTPDNATAQALAQDASVTDTFYYEIKDDGDVNASTATLVFTITGQNDAPTISQTTANNFTEDSTSTGATVGVFDVNDEETADGSLTVTISDETNYAISYDGAGTATVTLTDVGAATVNAGNELPSYTVTVTDGNSSTATATHDPSVTTVNDAPTISQTTANNFTEDSTSTGATVGVFDVNDEETADGSLTVTISDETNYAISYDGAGTATVTLTDLGRGNS